jgi:hypothetical protein
MPTSFSTLFGSNLHGVKVTWGNDPNKAGDRVLSINFELKMYSAKLTGGCLSACGANPLDTFYATTGWDTSTLTGGSTIDKNLNFVMTWKNPTGTIPPFDGFNAHLIVKIGPTLVTPNLKINWVPNSGSTVVYDLKPTAINKVPVEKDDVTGTNPLYPSDNVTPVAAELNTDLCTELWRFSDTSVSCVLAKGTVERSFKTKDPFNLPG